MLPIEQLTTEELHQIEIRRLTTRLEIAEAALAEAARRFNAKDMEGLRLLLCDKDARSNAYEVWHKKTFRSATDAENPS